MAVQWALPSRPAQSPQSGSNRAALAWPHLLTLLLIHKARTGDSHWESREGKAPPGLRTHA